MSEHNKRLTEQELFRIKLRTLVIQKSDEFDANDRERKSHEVPSKRSTRLRGAITRGSTSYYGTVKVPRSVVTKDGLEYVRNGNVTCGRWSVTAMINMIAAKDACTREASDSEETRLVRSSTNAYTTKSYRN